MKFLQKMMLVIGLPLVASSASAALVGVTQGFPDVAVPTTTYSYDSTTGIFLVEARGAFSATTDTSAKNITGPSPIGAEYQFALYVDSNGDYTTGTSGVQVASKIGLSDITVNTIRMFGDTNEGTGLTVLGGEVLDFGWDGNNTIDALFSVITAEDSELFTSSLAGFILQDTDHPIDFSRSFGFGFDGTYANESDTFAENVIVPPVAVSEPGVLVLMFAGVLVMVGFRRRLAVK